MGSGLVMDIIQCLEARGCHHLISLIFSRLSSPELTACSLVSRRWALLVQQLVWANPGVRGRVLDNKMRGEHTSSEHRLASYGRIVECGLHLLGTGNIYSLWVLHAGPGGLECDQWCLLQTWGRVRGERVTCRDKDLSADVDTISCAEFRQQVLALGFTSGEVTLHQSVNRDGQSVMKCKSVIRTHSKTVSRIVIQAGLIVTAGQDCAITVLRVTQDGAVTITHLLQGHVSRVRAVSVSRHLILSGSDDRSAKLWSVHPSQPRSSSAVVTLSGHAWPVTSVCLRGHTAVTADSCTIRVWQLPAGTILLTISDVIHIIQVELDLSAGCLYVSDEGCSVHCYHTSQMREKDKSTAAWLRKAADSSVKCQQRWARGRSTLLSVIYEGKTNEKCDKNACLTVNIMDFL